MQYAYYSATCLSVMNRANVLDGVIVPVFQAIYTILHFLAGIFWTLNQALILVGYFLMTLTNWLVADAFKPLIEQVVNQTDGLLLPIFTIAMLVLAITYLVSVFAQIKIVEMRSALMWLLFAVFIFQFAPELYEGMEQLRRGLGGEFYTAGYNSLDGETGSIEGLNNIGVSAQVAMDTPINEFGAFVNFDTSIDGLDVAMAYLYASGCDVLRTSGCIELGWLPSEWYLTASGHAYFDNLKSGTFYPTMTNDERQASLSRASDGIWRAFSGVIVSFFGLLEQVIHLILAIAMGFSFVSLGIAVLFAFFKRTETITWAVFNMIVELFVQSIITSVLLSVVLTFVIIGAGTGNAVLLLGSSFVMIIFMVLLIRGALTALSRSINGLIGALSTAAGGALGTLTGAGSDVMSGIGAGVGAAAALQRGASLGQAAGLLLSGNQTLTRAAQYGQHAFGPDSTLGQLSADIFAGSSAANLVGRTAGGFLIEPNDSDADDDKPTSGSQYSAESRYQERPRGSYGRLPRTDRRLDFPALGTPIHAQDSEDGMDTEDGRAERSGQALSSPNSITRMLPHDNKADPVDIPTAPSMPPIGFGLPSLPQPDHLPEPSLPANFQPSPQAAAFVDDVERAFPGSSGRSPAGSPSSGLSAADVAKIDASDDDDFANLSADMTAAVSAYAARTGGIPAALPSPISAASSTSERDDLTSIRGIGPHTQRRLNEAGVNTYEDLASASPATLQAIEPRLKTDRAERMISDAAALVPSGDHRDHRASSGVSEPADDLTAIRGIGSHTQARFNNAGINTYADLAAASPETLQSLVPRLSADNAARFVAEAGTLSASAGSSVGGLSTGDVAKIDASDDDDFAQLGNSITAKASSSTDTASDREAAGVSSVSPAPTHAPDNSVPPSISAPVASPAATVNTSMTDNNARTGSDLASTVSGAYPTVTPDFAAISTGLAAALR
jgi:predicted flap endonuclease-1-like 5' DNA nuclease